MRHPDILQILSGRGERFIGGWEARFMNVNDDETTQKRPFDNFHNHEQSENKLELKYRIVLERSDGVLNWIACYDPLVCRRPCPPPQNPDDQVAR